MCCPWLLLGLLALSFLFTCFCVTLIYYNYFHHLECTKRICRGYEYIP